MLFIAVGKIQSTTSGKPTKCGRFGTQWNQQRLKEFDRRPASNRMLSIAPKLTRSRAHLGSGDGGAWTEGEKREPQGHALAGLFLDYLLKQVVWR